MQVVWDIPQWIRSWYTQSRVLSAKEHSGTSHKTLFRYEILCTVPISWRYHVFVRQSSAVWAYLTAIPPDPAKSTVPSNLRTPSEQGWSGSVGHVGRVRFVRTWQPQVCLLKDMCKLINVYRLVQLFGVSPPLLDIAIHKVVYGTSVLSAFRAAQTCKNYTSTEMCRNNEKWDFIMSHPFFSVLFRSRFRVQKHHLEEFRNSSRKWEKSWSGGKQRKLQKVFGGLGKLAEEENTTKWTWCTNCYVRDLFKYILDVYSNYTAHVLCGWYRYNP